MSGNPIGIVICRVGAILLVVSSVKSIGFLIVPLLEAPADLDKFLVMSVLMVLAPLVSALILAVYAEKISSTRFDASRFAISDSLGSMELISIGTFLIGIYVLVFGVVAMFQAESVNFSQQILIQDSERLAERMSAHAIGRRISYTVQIILGLVLLIRGKGGLRN